jgi:hypothetical protein
MKDRSMLKVGGICGIVVGILAIVSGGSLLLAPQEQSGPTPILYPGAHLVSFAENSTAIMIHYWALIIAPLLVIAVNFALTDLLRPVHEGLARWLSALGVISVAVQAANYVLAQSHTPLLAARYVQADASTQAAIAAMGPRWIDPDFWITFGLSGIWLIAVGWLALRGAKLPKALAWVGIACGISYWLIPGGFVLRLPAAISLAAGLVGMVLAPLWWIWIGVFLTKTGEEAG